MDPYSLAAMAAAPVLQGLGSAMATPIGATASSGQNVFDFGNWTVSTGSSRADATNTTPSTSSVSNSGGGGGLDMNMIVVGLMAFVVIKKMG